MQGLPNVGDVLDETYRIEELIGQGGFGAVYLARQMSMDRQVAIKVLVAHAMNVDEMIERFRREVMAVRNLSHPNTIRIYDFRGDREDGMLYYVMEFVKGSTLKDLIKEAPISIKRVKHILRQILKSLSEAHSYGIVHRDLKPANIMLADLHGETDFVKVVDFGIAKIMNNQENDDDADPLTSAGVLVGTLRYMAPEQITGQGIGPQSDLYALGLIAIEMLTGKSVFEGTGRWEVLHKQISDDPVDIPAELIQSEIGKFLTTALEKRLELRYKTADEMLAALDAVPDGSPKAAAVAPKSDDATQMAPLPAVAAQPAQPQADPTGVVSRAQVDDDATQIAELPSEAYARSRSRRSLHGP
ncbi:MAG: serine/threonine-protein kinase [bacterium]